MILRFDGFQAGGLLLRSLQLLITISCGPLRQPDKHYLIILHHLPVLPRGLLQQEVFSLPTLQDAGAASPAVEAMALQ